MYDSIAGSRHGATIHATLLDSKSNSNSGFSLGFAFRASDTKQKTKNARQQRNSTSCAHSLPPLIPAQLTYSLKQSRFRYNTTDTTHAHQFSSLDSQAQFDVLLVVFRVQFCRCRGRDDGEEGTTTTTTINRYTKEWPPSPLRAQFSIYCFFFSFSFSASGPKRLPLFAPPPPPDWYTLTHTHTRTWPIH